MTSDIAISHKKLKISDPQRNLKIYDSLVKRNITLSPRDQFYYARELYYHKRFAEAINLLNKFLDSNKGWFEDCIDACKILSYCYYEINEPDKALNSLFNSFKYTIPRGEICCDIGQHFLDRNRYNEAIFWYTTASNLSIPASEGFITIDCYGYIPLMQLCVCYFRIGDIENSKKYNELAGKIKPNDSAYLFNKEFFKNYK